MQLMPDNDEVVLCLKYRESLSVIGWLHGRNLIVGIKDDADPFVLDPYYNPRCFNPDMFPFAGPQALDREDKTEFFQVLKGEKEFQLNGAGNGKFTVR